MTMKNHFLAALSVLIFALQPHLAVARGGYVLHSSVPKSEFSSRTYAPRSSFHLPAAHSNERSYRTDGAHYTREYRRRDGTDVSAYHATNPNHTKRDNWSSRGNINPYTGQPGTHNPYP